MSARTKPIRRGAGKPASSNTLPGWQGNPLALPANPRPPLVPLALDLSLEGYYAAAVAIGLLASQHREPDPKWACQWAFDMGQRMAHEERKRRKR